MVIFYNWNHVGYTGIPSLLLILPSQSANIELVFTHPITFNSMLMTFPMNLYRNCFHVCLCTFDLWIIVAKRIKKKNQSILNTQDETQFTTLYHLKHKIAAVICQSPWIKSRSSPLNSQAAKCQMTTPGHGSGGKHKYKHPENIFIFKLCILITEYLLLYQHMHKQFLV